MPACRVLVLACAVACQGARGSGSSATAPPRTIEATAADGAVVGRIVADSACRVSIEGVELTVPGRPIATQIGSARWSTDDAANGTTFKHDDIPVARLYARQVFDAHGVRLIDISASGDVAIGGRVVRRAQPAKDRTAAIQIVNLGAGSAPASGRDEGFRVTGLSATPDDLALAALFTARELDRDLRALIACNHVLPPARGHE